MRLSPIIWEHEGNRAVRLGDWKLMSEGNTHWELYNMRDDRTELNDLSGYQPRRFGEHDPNVRRLGRPGGALPWPVVPDVTASPRAGTRHIHEVP